MSTLIIILQYLPQVISIIKKIKSMADDGLSKKEIENALNKIEFAFENIEDDDDLADNLDNQWVQSTGAREEVPPPLQSDRGAKSES